MPSPFLGFVYPFFLDASAAQKQRRSCAEFFLMSDIKCCIKCQFCAYVQYLYLYLGVCIIPPPHRPKPCRWRVSAGQVSVIKFVMSCRHGKGFLSAIYFISALLFLFPLSLCLAFLLAYFYGAHTDADTDTDTGTYTTTDTEIHRYYRDGELQLLLCSRLWHVYFCLYSISYDF